ncbi:MAG: class I SAM-dependent methyltransferase [Candidatus Eremiobacteraeota bacterium]|nr:class I SAM-dependent methyltransferase [Candidatus Eremiobacteraeota bacterium]
MADSNLPRGCGMGDIKTGKLELSDVSNTGLLTAFCHAVESRSKEPLLEDPRAEAIADRLKPMLESSPERLLRSIARGRFQAGLVVHLALRARKYDQYARDFAARHQGGCVVNLGCGLDTRFWRIDDGCLQLYDLDLPEMISLKRELVEETDRYHLIGLSVLDHLWMDSPAAEQAGPFLFLAEGLLMYLPPDGARGLILELQSRFPGSELVFETVNSAWLEPALKWMINLKLQKVLGLGKGTEFRFGIRDGHEIEEWSPGIHLLEEWSYFDEDEPRIGLIRRFRNWKLLRCAQWTVRCLLGKRADEKE